jgi:hypothetical protein
MKKVVGSLLIALIIVSGCSEKSTKAKFDTNPRPYYKTAKGKQKQKYYNKLQYGGKTSTTAKQGNR